MCVKLPLKYLNLDSYPPHSTNIYTCEVIFAPISIFLNTFMINPREREREREREGLVKLRPQFVLAY